MDLRQRQFSLIYIGILFNVLIVAGAQGQELETLILPDDEQAFDRLQVPGSAETTGLSGLSRMSVPNSTTTYYIIRQRDAMRNLISERLADIYRNDSDISIRFDQLGGEFIHIKFDEGRTEIRYFRFEDWLRIQLNEFLESGGSFNGGGSVEFLDYRIPLRACRELDNHISQIETNLQESVSNIGARSVITEFVVDGPYYQLSTRMNRLLGQFGVGGNVGPMFDAVHSTMLTVRECSRALEPNVGTMDF